MSLASAEYLTQADSTVRSDVYKLLSLVYKYPTPDLFEAYRSGEFLSELFDAMSMLPHLKPIAEDRAGWLEAAGKDLKGLTLPNFESQYISTFDVGMPQPPCPPYEGVFREGVERTSLLVEVSGFYHHFGLKMNPEEGKREQPDHLSVELEFLHFLTFKEGQMRSKGDEGDHDLLRGYVLAQKDFLERHLATWLQKFTEKMQKSSANPLFAKFAELTAQVASAELDHVRAMLEELGPFRSTEEGNNGKQDHA